MLLLFVVVSIDMYFGYKELRGPELNQVNAQQKTAANLPVDLPIPQETTEKQLSLHIPHEELGWIVNKNVKKSHVLVGNFDVIYTTDTQGFRTTQEHPLAERKIYIFGDSFTFGHGVNDDETFANIISSVWLDHRVKVVNAGANGYGITQMYRRFLDIQKQLNSGDLVIFTPISKDLLRSYKDFAVPAHYVFVPTTNNKIEYYPYFEGGEIKLGKLDTTGNRVKALLFHAPLTGDISRKIHRYLLGPIDFDDAQAMFDLIKNKSAAKGARFYLYFLPQVKDLIRGRYRYNVSRYDYLDIWDYFPAGDDAKQVIGFPDDGHWNCHGHEIAAYAIVTTLIKNDAIDKKYLRRSLDNMPELCMQNSVH